MDPAVEEKQKAKLKNPQGMGLKHRKRYSFCEVGVVVSFVGVVEVAGWRLDRLMNLLIFYERFLIGVHRLVVW